MRHRLILVAIGVVAALLWTTVASADAPIGGSSSLELSGQFLQSRGESQLSLTADANGGQHLEMTLSASRVGTGRRESDRRAFSPIDLSGQFNFSAPGISPVSGQVQGQLDQRGLVTLQLSDVSGAVNAVATLSPGAGNSVVVSLTGTLPLQPETSTTPPRTGASAQGAGAQPVDHSFWYLSRATGFSAYLLLFASLCLGLALSTRSLGTLLARWRAFDLHQVTALLALGFTALHMFSLLGDRYVGFTLGQLFIPFAASVRPAQNALGVVALYALIVVAGSFYVRRFIGQAMWRGIHYLSYAAYFAVLFHGVFAGSDTGQPWAIVLYWITGFVTLMLTLWRFVDAGARESAGEPSPRLTGGAA